MRLFEFISNHQGDILKDWEEFAVSLLPDSATLNQAELRDSAAEILDAIAADMASGQSKTEQVKKSPGQQNKTTTHISATAWDHAAERLAQKLTLEELIAEYRALRASVLRRWSDHPGKGSAEDYIDQTRFNEAVDESLAASVAWFDTPSREHEIDARELERAKERERDLRQSARAKDEFLAILGHELRNPLAPLQTALNLLERESSDLLDRLVPMMGRQLSHLVRLVDDLLDVSRVTRGTIDLRKDILDLNVAVQSAIEQVRSRIESRDHRLIMELSQCRLPVYGDSERLTQVVANLLSNAAKYTDPGGIITVTTGREEGQVYLSVRDTGFGIAAQDFSKVFELFGKVPTHQGHAGGGGLGVGLALSRQLVQMHDGTIEVRSKGAGHGSEFLVQLPLGSPDHEVSTGSNPAASRGDRSRRVLVVDDNVDAAEGLRMLLALRGHTVEAVHSGTAALQAVERFTPDVILLDLGLPDMSGIEVARKIRSLPAGETVHLVAVTGWGQDEDKARTKEAGFDDHRTKPVGAAELIAVLAALDQR